LILFSVVLLAGGISVYLAQSIYFAAEEIRREHHQINVADAIHSTIHHFLFDLQRAGMLSLPFPDSARSAFRAELEHLLEREDDYHQESSERLVIDQIHRISSELFKLSEKIGIERPNLRAGLNAQHLDELEALRSKIQLLAHTLRAVHKGRMDQLLEENKGNMQWIFGFYGTFFLVGAILVVGASLYFARRLGRPLRRLAQAAEELSDGRFYKKIPVLSRDEIGLVSHTFNVMADRVKENEEHLKALTVLKERERIAQELHDSVAQAVAAMHLKLCEAEDGFTRKDDQLIQNNLSEMRQIVDGAYDDVRQAIFGLRTMVSKGTGLIPSLTEYLHDYSEMRKVSVGLRVVDPEAVRFSPHVEVQLIRIIHEALMNVSKHAQANRSVITFELAAADANITIEDDGEGFSLEEVQRDSLHFGLKTMKERAEAVGGKLTIESVPGKGTKVIVRLPLREDGSYETHSSSDSR
jgi:two-component system nitrate/nitrite sensor histidine kinase NarX